MAFQRSAFQNDAYQGGVEVLVTPDAGQVPAGSVTGRGVPARRRYIMPDGRVFLATTQEVLALLQMYAVPKAAPPKPQAQAGDAISTPRLTLERRDVKFVPAQDALPGTYKAVISERFVYRAPEEAYRQAEIIANRIRDDEEAIIALLM